MTDLVITRGLPGSGKSTLAKAWVAEAPAGLRCYVDRDDLRIMMFSRWGLLSAKEEDAVTVAQHSMVKVLLQNGRDVVVADTFLRDDRLQPMITIAKTALADIEYLDLRSVPVETCIARDAERAARGGRQVGADVIRMMADRYGLPQ